MSDTNTQQQTKTKQETKKEYQTPQLVRHDTFARITQEAPDGPQVDAFDLLS
jgi:hypothetical protein